MYLYETHIHTKEGSKCSPALAEIMARTCKEKGYTGMVITDHFISGNTAVPRELPWEQWLEKFMLGYYNAKKTGDKIGLSVFFGIEHNISGFDLLTYGLDTEFFLKSKEIFKYKFTSYCDCIHEAGGFIINAHPFREAEYIPQRTEEPNSTHIDAVEVHNGAHGHSNYDEKALEFAIKYNLSMSAGSDAHTPDRINSGVYFPEKAETIQDIITMFKERKQILMQG